MVSKLEIGWFAGIFDGEGTTTIRMKVTETKNYGMRPRYWTEMTVVNTDKNIIDRCHSFLDELNVNHRVYLRKARKENTKPMYTITINGAGIKTLLPKIKNHCIKKHEFEILEKALKLGERNQKRGGNKEGLRGKAPMPDEVLDKFDTLRMKLVAMHGRQAANLVTLSSKDYKRGI